MKLAIYLSNARMRLRTRIVKCTHEDYIICPCQIPRNKTQSIEVESSRYKGKEDSKKAIVAGAIEVMIIL